MGQGIKKRGLNGIKREKRDLSDVAAEGGEVLSGPGPELDVLVEGGGREEIPVGREAHDVDQLSVA